MRYVKNYGPQVRCMRSEFNLKVAKMQRRKKSKTIKFNFIASSLSEGNWGDEDSRIFQKNLLFPVSPLPSGGVQNYFILVRAFVIVNTCI